MEKFHDINDFLAKWAADELSHEEKEAFKKTEDYKYYQAILEGTELLEVPTYDSEDFFAAVQRKKSNEKKVVRLVPNWAYAVAASVAVIFGYFFLFDNTVNHTTGFGEQLVITLPDDSEVILNAKSSLEYDKDDWEEGERNVSLDGEAFFKVEKGSDFVVDADDGKVAVLGTQFTVNTNSDVFEVICYEGRVKVTKAPLDKVIIAGEAVRMVESTIESWNVDAQAPSWMSGESSFSNAPIHQVIKALENQYNISFKSQDIDPDLRFTGSFTHNNLEIALRSVFESMEIKFTFIDKITIDLVDEE